MTDEKLAAYRAQFGDADLSPKQYVLFLDLLDEGRKWQDIADRLTEEIEALRHDIARHVQIASEQAEEIDRLRDAIFALGVDKW